MFPMVLSVKPPTPRPHRRWCSCQLDDVSRVAADADVVVGEPHRLHVDIVIRPARDVPVGAARGIHGLVAPV